MTDFQRTSRTISLYRRPLSPGTLPFANAANQTPGIDGTENIKEVVKQKYGEAALRVKSGGSSWCGVSAATSCCDPITINLYNASQAGQIPEEALLASLGWQSDRAAQLNPGEIVLDLGSGGGIDVLLSARRVAYLQICTICSGLTALLRVQHSA